MKGSSSTVPVTSILLFSAQVITVHALIARLVHT